MAVGVWKGYSAAHPDPLADSALQAFVEERASTTNQVIAGAAAKWDAATKQTHEKAKAALEAAAIATILGTLFLGMAVLLTWLTPEEKAEASTYCVSGSNGAVVELEGSVPAVTSGSLVIVPCPGS